MVGRPRVAAGSRALLPTYRSNAAQRVQKECRVAKGLHLRGAGSGIVPSKELRKPETGLLMPGSWYCTVSTGPEWESFQNIY